MTKKTPDAYLPGWARPLVQERWRYKVMHGGRGGGKSWAVAIALLTLAASKPLRVLCAREVQRSMRDSVHRLLRDQIERMGLSGFYEVTDSEIRGRNGSVFLFTGLLSHTVDTIKSFEGVDICWVEEAHSVSYRSWSVLTPTIRKDGSEIWMTLNPHLETDATYVRFIIKPPADAWVRKVNWSDNPWFPDVLDKERREDKMRRPDEYRNKWGGEPLVAAEGAIYAQEIERMHDEGRITTVLPDPKLPVHTVWDLGWADYMAIAFVQRTPFDFRVIDYVQDSHRTLDDYVINELQTRQHLWGTDYLPHDAEHGDFKTGQTAQQILESMGRTTDVLERVSVEAGIRLARGIFTQGYVDKDNCVELLSALKHYRRQINTRTMSPGAPLHDDHSHGADVWRYLAMALPRMDNAGLRQSARQIVRRGSWMAR